MLINMTQGQTFLRKSTYSNTVKTLTVTRLSGLNSRLSKDWAIFFQYSSTVKHSWAYRLLFTASFVK